MDEESIENIDSTNDATEEVVNTEEVEEVVADTTDEDEAPDDSELVEKNRKLFERAKKAEAEARALREKIQAKVPAVAPPEKQDGLSSMDTIALIDAKVTNKDDIETVQEYARLKGLSISDALATPLVKTILKDNAEQRQTAEASNTAPARRGSIKLTDEQILSNAAQGKFTDDPEALAEARMAAKRNK